MIAGATIGAAAGGAAGKGVASAVNPTVEDEYWRGAYRNASYYSAGRTRRLRACVPARLQQPLASRRPFRRSGAETLARVGCHEGRFTPHMERGEARHARRVGSHRLGIPAQRFARKLMQH